MALRLYHRRRDEGGKRIEGYVVLWDGDREVGRLEYAVPSHLYGVTATFEGRGGEDAISLGIGVGAASVYVLSSHAIARALSNVVLRVFPSDMGSAYSGRNFGLRFHDHAVWWQLGADDYGWTSKRPRWKDGSWHPLGHKCRQGEPEVLERREVLVSLPERSYRGIAELQRTRWGFQKLPRFLDREDRHVSIVMLDGEQIPIPGKGENSYDCDEDATFGISCQASTIEEGVGRLVASTLRDRLRYGGARWKPEERKPGPPTGPITSDRGPVSAA